MAIVITFMASKVFIEGIMYGNLLKGVFNCWLVLLGSLRTGLGNSLLIINSGASINVKVQSKLHTYEIRP